MRLGQRGALERMAHLVCELLHRLGERGARADHPCPLTQTDLADLLGMSAVHTNRVLQTLRRRGLAGLARGRLLSPDTMGLAALARFSPDYLR